MLTEARAQLTAPIAVLLVEDDADEARLVTEALTDGTDNACSVRVVRHLAAALDSLRAGPVDVVLLDLGLSDSRGAATFDAVHRQAPNVPIIVITGEDSADLGLQLVRRGAQDYLVKGHVDGGATVRAIRYALERATSARTLRERERRFRELAENIDEVFFIQSADYSETLYISPAYETIWGRTCQSLYDDPKSFVEAVVPEDRTALFDAIARNQTGEKSKPVEFRVIRPDGTTRWLMSRSAGIRDDRGVVYRISGVVSDVSDRHHMEAALRESEARYRKLTETSFDGIVRTEEGFVCEVNAGFVRMFGFLDANEVLHRPISDFVADESLSDLADRAMREVEGRYDFAGKRKDGTIIQVEATARTHEAGSRRGRLTALRDVTEKRTLEEQFRQAQKMEAVGRLAGGVAHDFNNLLMVITGYGELLLDDLGPDDPRHSHADEILKAATAAAGLTRQLLAFSRQQVIQPRLLNLEAVVQDSEKMLRRMIGEDIELVTAMNPSPATVRIDPSQLEQVVMNLVVNARDAMPDGGRVTIETASVELSDAYARGHWPATPGRYAMLAVTDTGVGMDETTRARVFEPFFTTKELGKGTGLGLSMVYGIVKQSGGFIWVYSEPGNGTTFKIYLPRVDEAAESLRPTGEIEIVPRGTETVLLAEDEPAVRAVVQQVLERHGYTVLVAPNGNLALKLVAANPGAVQLLLTDVVMPGMSGRQLAAQFSALQPGARVLFMSGYTSDAVVRHGVLEPGIAYLQKPFSPEALARKVRQVLDGS
jgi:two-component system cell cycle sensor histidine kinase/response regulator CckA